MSSNVHSSNVIKYNENILVCGSNKEGQIALGDQNERVDSLSRISEGDFVDESVHSVVCGPLHSVFLGSQGVWVCGNNNNSRLGLGASFSIRTKTRVAFKICSPPEFVRRKVKQVCCGENHTVFLMEDYTLWSCGGNHRGQLAIPSLRTICDEPKQIEFAHQVSSIACGLEHTLFLTSNGHVYSCGSDEYGQLGANKLDRTDVRQPSRIGEEYGDGTYSGIECGFYFSALITSGPHQKLLTCGRNHYGQLCHNDLINKYTPTVVKSDVDIGQIKSVVCGQHHMVVLNADGLVFVGGWNGYGQLGIGDGRDRGPTMYISVNCGAAHTCFVTQKDVYMCGYNASGQLGLGHQESKISTPTPIHTRAPVAQISCGTVHTIVLLQKQQFKHKPTFKFGDLEQYSWMFDCRVTTTESTSEGIPACADVIRQRCPRLIDLNKSSVREDNTLIICSDLSDRATVVLLNYIMYDRLELDGTGTDRIDTCCELIKWNPKIERLESLLLCELYQSVEEDPVSLILKIDSIIDSQKRRMIRGHVISLLNNRVRSGSFKDLKKREQLSHHLCMEIMMSEGNGFCALEDLDYGQSTLESDLSNMFEECQKSMGGDVELVLSNGSIRAHKLILSCRCEFFRKNFTHGWCDNHAKRVELFSGGGVEDQVAIQTHYAFIKYLYTGTFDDITPSNAVSLIKLWNFYCMPLDDPVCKRAQEVICDGLNADNVLILYGYLDQLKGVFKELEQACVNVMCEHWIAIHDRFSNDEIFHWLSNVEYADINRRHLSQLKKAVKEKQTSESSTTK
ncbi:E3 ubiquitin-protein ligase HERC [Acrasis kona]|uniref:E3 ubiquitin-protein ligase HERC n=1 Tax=Acrasis kona TaxID=1008807 RepID=A0AAW2YZG5_9EUKA